jgi:hypothetical protein
MNAFVGDYSQRVVPIIKDEQLAEIMFHHPMAGFDHTITHLNNNCQPMIFK